MNNEYYEELRKRARLEIAEAILRLVEKEGSAMCEVQPPYEVIISMAESAAQTLVSFEIGYQLGEVRV